MSEATFTLTQLQLANELAFPDTMMVLFKKYDPDCWFVLHSDFVRLHNCSLTSMIFNYSRADYLRPIERPLGRMFDLIIADLIDGKIGGAA